MTNLPAQIQVGPFLYEVRCDQEAMDKHEHIHRTALLLGAVNYNETYIVIKPLQSAGSMRDTLLHEVIHAVDNSYHILPDDDTMERIIGVFATALLDTLRRNPELVRYLLTHEDAPPSS